MFPWFKKTAALFALAATLTTTALPKRAEAILVGQVWTVVVFSVGTLGSLMYPHEYYDSERRLLKTVFGLTFWTGLLLLDGGADAQFVAIHDSAQADRVGLSAPELAAYNAELPQINQLREEVKQELLSQQPANEQQAWSLAQGLWQAKASELSPEAFGALQKVSLAFAQSARNR